MSLRILARAGMLTVLTAAAIGGVAAPLAAQETMQTYVVTSTTESRAGRAVQREVLTLQSDDGRSRLRVASGDSMFAMPVALTAGGEIATPSQDHSVTCYNMAMEALAHGRSDADPATVFVAFASSVVRVPLRLQTTHSAGTSRMFTLSGTSTGILHDGENTTPAGIAIDATIDDENGTLQTATFDELNYVGATGNVIGRSTCILERATPRLRRQTQA